MSLQVWLPLNGSLENQGLLNSPSKIVLQSGNSFAANGKIGKCLSSTSTNVTYFQDTSNNKLISLFNSGRIYSMAFWYKLTGNSASSSIVQIGTTTPSSGSGNGTFGFWWTKDSSGTNPRLVWNDGDNGKRILSKKNDNSDIATDYTNWHHLVAIIDKTNMAAQKQIFYLDGVLVRDEVYNNSSANALTITNANNYIYLRPYDALLNDFRIYDHALSDKEIDELSRGLVFHHKLDCEPINNIMYDSSGNGYHGTVLNGWSTVTDSPRYDLCGHPTATNQKIKIDNLPVTGFSNSYSFTWWGKTNNYSNMMWGFQNGVRLNGIYTGRLWNTGDSSNNPLYNIGTTTQVTAPPVDTWFFWAMVCNGTKCYVYKDGELWAEAKTYKTITGSTLYINGWDTSTSYSSNAMYISDFRLYSTALTEAQIKELYNTSGTIDNMGNVYARKFVEEED